MASNVLLLRAPTQGQDDRYESTFIEAGCHAISVPVLETVSTNLLDLKTIITAGPAAAGFEGVVITSARACEAWKSVVGELVGSVEAAVDTWSTTPFYVVGPGTASALASIQETYEHTPYTPYIVRGESSGTSERLARFICSQPQSDVPKKVLYLTGDKNKDTVPTILGEAGIKVIPLKVYETRGSQTFESDLEGVLKGVSNDVKPWWIVHFAPSAAGFVTPILKKHFTFSDSGPQSARIAAIGPVTASFLRDELNIPVDVVSPSPTPQDLLAVVAAYDAAAV
ncbi:Uroporphyrinogen-III synthase [Hypsizygus marmoreus]|uniref:Uroporphyrinogen-III synthase n=1 Tax=Hypsizygus marmoreus TaxID=39966 RepID=A0A369J8T9_HYPMA|nr:Uroporphyrinogen-III synthase [Hypsizygus marmoreus]